MLQWKDRQIDRASTMQGLTPVARDNAIDDIEASTRLLNGMNSIMGVNST